MLRTDRAPRRHPFPVLFALLATLVAMAAPGAASAAEPIRLSPRAAFTRFDAPTQVTNAGDRTNRLFIVERPGTIRVLRNGALQSGYFLDIRSSVEDGGERGLLGLAFHPRFESNRLLYVFFTRNGGDVVVARYTANASGTRVSAATGRSLLVIEHSARANHNGGGMAFGRDGYLYIGVGDGGGGGDPDRNGQNKSTLLGKVLRIDVNGKGAGPFGRYANPRSNPFYGTKPGLSEIWAYGLRNPWRISFDRGTGRFYIGDVGQASWEEIDREPSGLTGGRNYGWNVMEGAHCYPPATSSCSLAGDVLPAAEYSHAGGNCSITGGYVYRGSAFPVLVGQYVFADFCSGRIWTLPQGGGTASLALRADTSVMISSFGESEGGELYAVTIDGRLFRVEAS
jgi:glucose/arabinose dehydrogenase